MRHDITPAIVRDFNEDDSQMEVMATPYNSVSFVRGLGDSGYRVQVVKHECPAKMCGFDRMIRRWDVSPERPDEVRYWCLYPNCRHFVSDQLSHVCHNNYPQMSTRTPVIFEDGPV